MASGTELVYDNSNWGKWWDSATIFTGKNGHAGTNWSASLMGASGGDGGGINGVQYFGKAAVNGMEIWNTALMTDMAQSAAEFQAEMAASAALFQGAIAAADYRQAGDTAVKNIGIVQREAADATTLRYNALQKEVSAQRVAAAGSGIDLSSRTVGKAEQSSRAAANWDVTRINATAKNRADSLNQQAEMAYRNSAFATINAEYQAETAKIMGDYQSELAGISGKFGMIKSGINMVNNIGKGIADIWSGGWVSNADMGNRLSGGSKGLGEI